MITTYLNNKIHTWKRVNTNTQSKGNILFDIFKCKNCGCIGTRYDFNNSKFQIDDSIYHISKIENCNKSVMKRKVKQIAMKRKKR